MRKDEEIRRQLRAASAREAWRRKKLRWMELTAAAVVADETVAEAGSKRKTPSAGGTAVVVVAAAVVVEARGSASAMLVQNRIGRERVAWVSP